MRSPAAHQALLMATAAVAVKINGQKSVTEAKNGLL